MRFLTIPVFLIVLGCAKESALEQTLFSDVTTEAGINFRNDLTFTEQLNPYTYRNFYNGAGVAIGDINNDGLLDIYFAGNQSDNKLYLNQGNFTFKDITETAGVACPNVWSTGVTFVDINGDGLLDIYVCKSGNPDAPRRHNELFINNGDLTFTEKSQEYGLDVVGLSVQAAFFDFDKDGDLDCYLLTNSIKSVGHYDLVKDQRKIPDPQGGGNKFFINEGGKFRDYSEEAGIYRSNIGFGLGITLGDFNNDSWTDIFISNDFFERDYLYINNQQGGFTESLTDYFQSISMGSMGADWADLDNDGIPELFVTEMLPDSLSRKKTKTVYENWDKYQMNILTGYHYQLPRNVLQKKISDDNYVEVGRLAGVASTEWSWGALLFDMNNDGYRDIFVANGIYKDLLDRDYLTYTGAEDNIRKMMAEEKDVIMKLVDLMPSSAVPNYAFRNDGQLIFTNTATEWGLGKPMFSSGSAYGDLDNDGDLDLVVNNINGPSVIYRNNSDTATFKRISLVLKQDGKNTFAVGAEVMAYYSNRVHLADNFVTRGFQSSVQPKVHIGLGENVTSVDSLVIRWPDEGYTILYQVPVNQEIVINKQEVEVIHDFPFWRVGNGQAPIERISNSVFKHKGSGLVDFNRDRLLPMMYSNETPSLSKGDIHNDGTATIYIGGGKDQPGGFIRFRDGKFELTHSSVAAKYSASEETKSVLFDANGDGYLDLYLASGGRFYSKSSSVLTDKIFLNNGKGEFYESPHPLPFREFISTSVVVPIDFDRDGDVDLLVAERFHPFAYGLDGRAFLFENDGSGLFKDVTETRASFLSDIGMITDAVAVDFNSDGWEDLVLVGDWMPVIALKNERGNFIDISGEWGLEDTRGWWHSIAAADLNQDGKVDFVVANHGLNTFFKPGDRMYLNDFDANGSVEQIFCTYENGKYYPVVDKDELLSQLPFLKKDLLYYKDYGNKSMEELFPENILSKSKVFEVDRLASMLFLSNATGYEQVELPREAQYSPLYSLLVTDLDNDGVMDLIAGGNQYQVRPQFGRYDGSHGWFFKGVLEAGVFTFSSGIDLNVKGQIRDIELLEVKGNRYILFAKYDDELEIVKVRD
jgi:enediyne biosynthesis protein E4